MFLYERFCLWLGHLKLSRVILLVSIILFMVPLVTHYYLSKYESSTTLGSNHMRHTLEAFGDLSTMNVADLKIRIEEMLRIKNVELHVAYHRNILEPIKTEDAPAPETLLQTIFCRCTKDCSSGKCGCRKVILNCSAACLHCEGKCLNGVSFNEEDDNDDEELQETPTNEDEQMTEEEPGPSQAKRMKKSC